MITMREIFVHHWKIIELFVDAVDANMPKVGISRTNNGYPGLGKRVRGGDLGDPLCIVLKELVPFILYTALGVLYIG